jgi:hypothetical protein
VRPSSLFYAIAFAALALSVAGFVTSVQNEDSTIAAGAGIIAAVGWFVCALMVKRGR